MAGRCRQELTLAGGKVLDFIREGGPSALLVNTKVLVIRGPLPDSGGLGLEVAVSRHAALPAQRFACLANVAAVQDLSLIHI